MQVATGSFGYGYSPLNLLDSIPFLIEACAKVNELFNLFQVDPLNHGQYSDLGVSNSYKTNFIVKSILVDGWPPLACGILSSSSDIEGCRAVVSGVIWIRLRSSHTGVAMSIYQKVNQTKLVKKLFCIHFTLGCLSLTMSCVFVMSIWSFSDRIIKHINKLVLSIRSRRFGK